MITPKWAAKIWFDTDWIYLDIGHTVRVEYSTLGIEKILTLLKARDAQSKISTEGAPTQDQINHVFYGIRKKKHRPAYEITQEQYQSAKELIKAMKLCP